MSGVKEGLGGCLAILTIFCGGCGMWWYHAVQPRPIEEISAYGWKCECMLQSGSALDADYSIRISRTGLDESVTFQTPWAYLNGKFIDYRAIFIDDERLLISMMSKTYSGDPPIKQRDHVVVLGGKRLTVRIKPISAQYGPKPSNWTW